MRTDETIQLLLLDDHTLFREMLGRWLDTDSDFRVVAHCSSIPDALDALARDSIDLVLLDYDLGSGETGFQFIELARAAGYTGRILLLTAGMNNPEYVRALGLGVCGIVLKHSSPELLTEAVHKVMRGETSIDERCLQGLVEAVSNDPGSARPNTLTERERQVLKGVFAGWSNKEIGIQLHLSEASVKSALQQLFLKTGVRTRSQLVRVALEEYGNLWHLDS